MYFRNFNNILYDFEINGKRKLTLVKDVTKNVRIRTSILANLTLYDEYDIREGDTPEIISEKVYGSAEYHWVVMLCNERFDWIADFPLTQPEMDKFLTQKYGAGNEDDTHHYVNNAGFQVSSDDAEAASVSNRTYEDNVNEAKRRIKLIAPTLLFKILNSFDELI